MSFVTERGFVQECLLADVYVHVPLKKILQINFVVKQKWTFVTDCYKAYFSPKKYLDCVARGDTHTVFDSTGYTMCKALLCVLSVSCVDRRSIDSC